MILHLKQKNHNYAIMRNIVYIIALACLVACSQVNRMSAQMERSNQMIETNSSAIGKSSEIIQTNTAAVAESTQTLKDFNQMVNNPLLVPVGCSAVVLLLLLPSFVFFRSYRKLVGKVDKLIEKIQ